MLSTLGTRLERQSGLGSVVLIAGFLIFARNPLFLLEPRIWAEEGSIYLANVFESGEFFALLHPHLGYYSLFNNLVVSAGVILLPLEYLAFITTGFSALLQLCTSIVIYESDGRLGDSKFQRLLNSLLPFLLGTPEVWLNTINCQFWLATGTFFILNSRHINRFQVIYLAMAFMTGVSSLFFLPFFAIRLFKEKSSSLKSVAILGTVALALQASAFLSYIQNGSSGRFKAELFGNFAPGIARTINVSYASNFAQVAFSIVALVGVFYFLRSSLLGRDFFGILYTLGALSTYVLLTVFASLNMYGGGRYALPSYCGIFAIVVSAIARKKNSKNLAMPFIRFLVALLLILKLKTFFSTSNFYSAEWPIWQIQLRERSCETPVDIKIFPPGWTVHIPPRSGLECM